MNQRLPKRRARRTLATFHDLFVISSDQYSSAEFRQRFRKQAVEAAERSDLIIAVSAFTARQVRDLLGVPEARIRVVHHGVRMPSASPMERKPVILSVGALQTRKNTARLVEAFEMLDAPEWRLVLAGSDGYGAEEIREQIARSPRRGAIELTGFVTDAERQRLYAEASIFAFPSLDEGFGIPILEAMSYGTPVVTSNRSSMPEVAGNAALLADPMNPAAIAGVLQRLADDAGERARLGELGRRRAAEFTWEQAAERTWEAYRELLP